MPYASAGWHTTSVRGNEQGPAQRKNGRKRIAACTKNEDPAQKRVLLQTTLMPSQECRATRYYEERNTPLTPKDAPAC